MYVEAVLSLNENEKKTPVPPAQYNLFPSHTIISYNSYTVCTGVYVYGARSAYVPADVNTPNISYEVLLNKSQSAQRFYIFTGPYRIYHTYL